MFISHITLFVFLVVAGAAAFFWAYKNYKSWKNNQHIALELDKLLKSTLETIKGGAKINNTSIDPSFDLGSAPMLSSILTVIVNKYGHVRLTIDDFKIPDEEYISVYLDVNTKEMILSVNHNLADTGVDSMAVWADPDDNTFH